MGLLGVFGLSLSVGVCVGLGSWGAGSVALSALILLGPFYQVSLIQVVTIFWLIFDTHCVLEELLLDFIVRLLRTQEVWLGLSYACCVLSLLFFFTLKFLEGILRPPLLLGLAAESRAFSSQIFSHFDHILFDCGALWYACLFLTLTSPVSLTSLRPHYIVYRLDSVLVDPAVVPVVPALPGHQQHAPALGVALASKYLADVEVVLREPVLAVRLLGHLHSWLAGGHHGAVLVPDTKYQNPSHAGPCTIQQIMQQLREGANTAYVVLALQSKYRTGRLLKQIVQNQSLMTCVLEYLQLGDLAAFSASSQEIYRRVRNSPQLQNRALKQRLSKLRKSTEYTFAWVGSRLPAGRDLGLECPVIDIVRLPMFRQKLNTQRVRKHSYQEILALKPAVPRQSTRQKAKLGPNSSYGHQSQARKLLKQTLFQPQSPAPDEQLRLLNALERDHQLTNIMSSALPQDKKYPVEYDEDSAKYIYEIEHKYALREPDSSFYSRRETLWQRLKANFTGRQQ